MQWGERESDISNDLLSPFLLFFLYFCSLVSLPTGLIMPYYALWRHLLPPLLRVVFVRKTVVIFSVLCCPCNSSYLCVVLPVHRYLFFSMYGVPVAIEAFPLFSDLASHPSEHLSFVSRCYIFSLIFFLFFLISSFLWSGLFSCVPVPCTLALLLLCPNELRLLFGLLCFAVVCDHRICMG